MRPFVSTCVALLAAGGLASGLIAGCSLNGLVFDLPDPAATGGGGGSISSSSSSSSGESTSSSSSGGGSGMASSSSGGGAMSSSSSSSGSPTEDCLNAVDDDNDGAIDCDDPDCGAAGYSCFPTVLPNGWSGPVILYDGDASQVPSCPGEQPNLEGDGATGLSSPNVTCNACSCTGVSIDCVYPTLTGYVDNACVTSAGAVFGPITGAMCGSAMVNGLLSFSAPSPVANITGCAPMGGGVQNAPAASFKAGARVCGGKTLGTCASGDVCAPPSPAPFHSKQCIMRPGPMGGSCPAPFTDKHDILDPGTLADNRGCSACSCTPQNQFSCQLTYTLYSDGACANSATTVAANGLCVTPAGGVTAASYNAAVTNVGTCSSLSGGQPTGSFSAQKTMTVCCMP